MDHFISLQSAIDMTRLYRLLHNTILDPEYRNRAVLPFSETFDRAAFDHVLQQQGCRKLRIYYGLDEQEKLHAIIVGVDANDKDMLPPTATNEDYQIIEVGVRCPDQCPPESPLNS